MKIYIWEKVDRVTGNWHDDGGLVVFAEDLDKAREELRLYGVPKDCEAFDKDPDYVVPVADGAYEEPGAIVFPNAGCC